MKHHKIYFFAGLLAGIVLSALFPVVKNSFSASFGTPASKAESEQAVVQAAGPEEPEIKDELTDTQTDTALPVPALSLPAASAPEETGLQVSSGDWVEWSSADVYHGGDRVLYQNRIYRAKWWTQNEKPGDSDVWEDTLETPATGLTQEPDMKEIAAPDNDIPENPKTAGARDTGFKVVAYYPSWKGEQFEKLQYDVLTHVVYAFAIPNADGTLKPLEHPELARRLIQDAHAHQAKILLAVGGWSYNDVPLEATFMEATSTDSRIQAFGDNIIEMCNTFGFDGVDMDWEHPRVDGGSSRRYEDLMLYLAERLHADGKLLTSAVISGATADGNVYYDAAAHTDTVLKAVDWIHVMAYDGGDGERHSSYSFAVNCGNYWKDTRHMPASKVVLGVPFYSRPGWAAYSDILSADSDADSHDISQFNGMEVYYNGIPTIQKKTKYASEHLGGIMIWEITQDTSVREKSLLRAVDDALQ